MAARYGKDVNTAYLSGRAVDTPGVRMVPNGKVHTAQAVFRICCSRGLDDAGKELCEFFTVICNGPAANLAEKYVSKGIRLAVAGSIRSNGGKSWYIAANQIQFFDRDYDPADGAIPDAVEGPADYGGETDFGAQLSIGGTR